ncbi:zinc metallopeptidase [Akkermansiaceae bacterium]|nr:zinc metallopeptidase [Akkermansiaceae bacterium]MDB4381947.1 zinc metallopeptidase [Akkermansiaceae bacterium]MDC1405341.1 zinc metallopeptidase [Akkermansiaceae bacterium]
METIYSVLAYGSPSSSGFLGISMTYWIILGGTALVSWLVSSKMKKRFNEHSQVPISMSGKEIAERMLAEEGITDVKVISTPGRLTDHYNPADKTVNLSESVYAQRNIAAAAVAAHECGHAVQHARAYVWLTFRSKMVPVVSIASNLMNVMFFLIIGAVFLNMPFLIWIYIGALATTTAFSIITLPVEFDASKRAMVWLRGSGAAASMDQDRAQNALFWAAMTYVVAALSSLAMLLYYLSQFLGNRD